MKKNPPIKPKYIQVVPKVPCWSSGMKKAPTMVPINTRYLIPQNLVRKKKEMKYDEQQIKGHKLFLPILYPSSRIFGISYSYHKKGHEYEEKCHSKAETIDSKVARSNSTINLCRIWNHEIGCLAGGVLTEWDLLHGRC